MRHNKKLDSMIDQGKDMIEYYRNNPIIAAYDLLGVKLAPIQQVVFEDMWFKSYSISVCGRGFGRQICPSYQ